MNTNIFLIRSSFILVFFILLGIQSTICQDNYHAGLQENFNAQFNLSTGEWLLFNNENEIYNAARSYGAMVNVVASEGSDFSIKANAKISAPGSNRWDAGWNIGIKKPITRGDKILIVFSLRSNSENGEAWFLAENATTFTKEAYLPITITPTWKQYLIPIEASAGYNMDALNLGFHLATQQQDIEIGGFTAINYKKTVQLGDLPSNLGNDQYEGNEDDAQWRTDAASRIEDLRKADLTIKVTDLQGNPVKGAQVSVKMKKHAFKFGSAITAHRLAGNNSYNVTYEDKILNFAGPNKGFNSVVFENDLKWPGWEQEWLVNKDELKKAVQWVAGNGLYLRGHTLVWPGESNMPSDIAANSTNIGYIKDRINTHLEEILNYNGLKGHVGEWDVLNEITTNRSLESYLQGKENYTTGREIYPEIFQKARSLDTSIGLWINDYVTLSLNNQPGNVQYDRFKSFVGEIVNSGVDIEGIGFQGHIGSFPNGIPKVLETLDDFYNAFGLKAKITEFDLPNQVSEELGAKYLVDFVTAIFSHPSMDGFLFWSFWDGATYMNPGANLFREDWTITPAGEAFSDLLYNQWWTEEDVITNTEGQSTVRGFKGKYQLGYTCNGINMDMEIDLEKDTLTTIVCDNISTSSRDLDHADMIKIYPNPVENRLIINSSLNDTYTARLFSMDGRIINSFLLQPGLNEFSIAVASGTYLLHIDSASGKFTKKVFVK
jgi:GH35 family endo-1,4-beta-xylanase